MIPCAGRTSTFGRLRAAAANSLGRLADPSALTSLRAATRDPEEPVRAAALAAVKKVESAQSAGQGTVPVPQPSGPARFYVAVGLPASRATGVTDSDLSAAREALRAKVGEIDGVALAPADESNAAAQKVLKARQLKGFYLESSVVSLETKRDPGAFERAHYIRTLHSWPA